MLKASLRCSSSWLTIKRLHFLVPFWMNTDVQKIISQHLSRIFSLQLFCLQQTENGIARTTYKKPEKVPWLLSLSEYFCAYVEKEVVSSQPKFDGLKCLNQPKHWVRLFASFLLLLHTFCRCIYHVEYIGSSLQTYGILFIPRLGSLLANVLYRFFNVRQVFKCNGFSASSQ